MLKFCCGHFKLVLIWTIKSFFFSLYFFRRDKHTVYKYSVVGDILGQEFTDTQNTQLRLKK